MDSIVFEHFDQLDAHLLGERMRTEAISLGLPIVIDIRAEDSPWYSVMLPGASAENFDWARRKRNLTLLTRLDTWALSQRRANGDDVIVKLGLEEKDHASHGGCIPVFLTDNTLVATVTVSGLPQKDDHDLALKHLTEFWLKQQKD